MSPSLTTKAKAEAVAARLRILAHPTRLMILSLLRAGERSVGDIEKVLKLKQPGLSQQLAELRQAGLVATRREAKSIFYRLADDRIDLLVSVLERLLGRGDQDLGGLPAAQPVSRSASPRSRDAAVFASAGPAMGRTPVPDV